MSFAQSTHSIRVRVELIQESLVPGVDTVLHDRLHERQELLFATSVIIDRQLFLQYAFQLLWWVVLDERGPWASAFDFQTMAGVLCFGIFICGCDEWNDEALYGCEELIVMSI